MKVNRPSALDKKSELLKNKKEKEKVEEEEEDEDEEEEEEDDSDEEDIDEIIKNKNPQTKPNPIKDIKKPINDTK